MLSLQHIKKSYDGVPVLQDITLDIKDGEIVSILGAQRMWKNYAARCDPGDN